MEEKVTSLGGGTLLRLILEAKRKIRHLTKEQLYELFHDIKMYN